jgi:hypothetical protein
MRRDRQLTLYEVVASVYPPRDHGASIVAEEPNHTSRMPQTNYKPKTCLASPWNYTTQTHARILLVAVRTLSRIQAVYSLPRCPIKFTNS